MRPSWDDYFMQISELVKTRSTCIRRQVGATVVLDRRIISTGYNGAPKGTTHCEVVGCMRELLNVPSGERHELCRATHAEQNAIVQAAYSGTSLKGATIYVTCQPCSMCAKLLINAGIVKIVYNGNYPDKLSLELLFEANVELVNYETIRNQV